MKSLSIQSLLLQISGIKLLFLPPHYLPAYPN